MRLNLRNINFGKFRIQHIDNPSKLVPLVLNPPQKMAIQMMIELQDKKKPIWTIDLKARRVGFSTLYCIMNAIHCVAFANATAMTVAHRAVPARAVFKSAIGAHQTILSDFGIPFQDYRTQHELRFPHEGGESRLTLATAKTIEGARGMTLTALQLSEAAFYEQAEDAFTALINTVVYQPETLLNIESTANGKAGGDGETFYQHWMDAVEGRNDFTPIFIPWFADPRNQMDPDLQDVKVANLNKEEKELIRLFKVSYAQLAWRRWAIPNKCQNYLDKFHQEFPSTPEEAFISSGDPAFNSDEIAIASETSRIGKRKVRFYGDIEMVEGAA